MKQFKSICVFCGSSEGKDPDILQAAYELGTILAERNIELIYGAAKIGVMARVAKGVQDHQGKVTGVIPKFLTTKEVVHEGLDDLIVTTTMHERKTKMHELSDAFITLPGGFGTLEELFEIITWAQLGLHQKPIGLLNINGFYDPLVNMLSTMVSQKFLKQENMDLLLVADTNKELFRKIEAYQPTVVPKWLNSLPKT
ncbi:TIGR00730 family Rossman fold protein [Aquimarina sp. ERC-38]|uniref:LOG family protein n=1 Tax=Aquimarina sp. ERC-38 TaxID=2949996 RepID=UPI0022458070|nr:TIGR00730 family Rossman fold protein [Aquimarina sp. ERC-38]UZO79360.1 TIGR00730 family Rossman fold protein [Aquimarina sp. ERC-38]